MSEQLEKYLISGESGLSNPNDPNFAEIDEKSLKFLSVRTKLLQRTYANQQVRVRKVDIKMYHPHLF